MKIIKLEAENIKRIRAISARNDPATSRAAALDIEVNGSAEIHRMMCLDAVHEWPGHTSAEISGLLISRGHKLDRWQVARRLPELMPRAVFQGKPRACAVTRRQCVTWWPSDSAPPMANAIGHHGSARDDAQTSIPVPVARQARRVVEEIHGGRPDVAPGSLF